MRSSTEMSASMVPNAWRPKFAKVRSLRLPGNLRVALSRDPGNGNLFDTDYLTTHLWGHVRNSEGKLIEVCDLGSGKITNMGVQALMLDGLMPNTSTAKNQLMANIKFHAWGTGVTAEAETDSRMQTPAAPTATECEEQASNTFAFAGEGTEGNIFKSTSPKIVAGGALAITEWGLFNGKKLANVTSHAEGTATAASATSITDAAYFTESTTSIRGEVGFAIQAKEVEGTAGEGWGIITSNTTGVATVQGGFWRNLNGTLGATCTPKATTKFTVNPIMFDHRVFSVINLSTGNTIEFPWELKIKSGG